MAVETTDVEVHELTVEEAHSLLDGMARRYLGISADEFIQAWDAGIIEVGDRPEVIRVATLVQLGRKNTS